MTIKATRINLDPREVRSSWTIACHFYHASDFKVESGVKSDGNARRNERHGSAETRNQIQIELKEKAREDKFSSTQSVPSQFRRLQDCRWGDLRFTLQNHIQTPVLSRHEYCTRMSLKSRPLSLRLNNLKCQRRQRWEVEWWTGCTCVDEAIKVTETWQWNHLDPSLWYHLDQCLDI